MTSSKLKILLRSPWDHEAFEFSDFVLTTDSHDASIQAVLCIWQPEPLLLTTDLPKLWYYTEPLSSPIYRQKLWQSCLELPENARSTHSHRLEAFRIPHITHVGPPDTIEPAHKNRKQRAIAIVSNSGHRWPFRRNRNLQRRNAYCISQHADLYGKHNNWAKYRHRNFDWPGQPSNYCGEISGRWSEAHKVEKMSHYTAALCMENTLEPYYFTEKFVDAAKAGCIPIYQAHPSVANSVLRGAKWIDPGNFKSADDCLHFAIHEDPSPYQQANEEWLKSAPVSQTEKKAVYERLGNILVKQIHA